MLEAITLYLYWRLFNIRDVKLIAMFSCQLFILWSKYWIANFLLLYHVVTEAHPNYQLTGELYEGFI